MRRLIRLSLRLFWTVIFGLLVTYAAVIAWTYLWPLDRPLPQGDAIVCLGASVSPDGTLGTGSALRADRCGALYRDGVAPLVLFSGGPPQNSAAAAMAMRSGVPEDAMLLEETSFSTLQNALFSLDLLPQDARLIIVTERFHLPRAWASFRAMGARDITLVPASTNRPRGRGLLLRETLAIWFNAGRYILWRASAPILPEATRTTLLH